MKFGTVNISAPKAILSLFSKYFEVMHKKWNVKNRFKYDIISTILLSTKNEKSNQI
jgi:hypothetical protein